MFVNSHYVLWKFSNCSSSELKPKNLCKVCWWRWSTRRKTRLVDHIVYYSFLRLVDLSAFNWKQKKILGIDGANSNRQFKLRPYGKFEDIKDFIKDKDVVLPFDGKDKSFEHEVLAAAIVPESYKKKIDVNQLYGSHKGCGMIPRKNNDLKLGYSYERVFGEKHRKLKEEKLKSMGMSDSAAQ